MAERSTTTCPRSRCHGPTTALPEDIREHMRLMCDIVALAFQTDKTRVATLLLCRNPSGLFYPFLDVRSAHHPASHDNRSDADERVVRDYVGQFAYLATKLDAMPEGNGMDLSLMDRMGVKLDHFGDADERLARI